LIRNMHKPSFIIIGAGGHASVIAGMLRSLDAPILGITDRDQSRVGARILDIPILGDDGVIGGFDAERIRLANGLGISPSAAKDRPPDPGTSLRRRIYQKLSTAGFAFPVLKHPSASVANEVDIAGGAQIMAGAVVQPRAVIGENAVINTAASVDHDCIIGAHAFVAPGAILCGTVHIGAGALIGAGAIILPGVAIGENAVIGAGACVRGDVEAGRLSR
jgi:sugar O-acyltransferase (sialic acid O-acetyltransferase NeuD family)